MRRMRRMDGRQKFMQISKCEKEAKETISLFLYLDVHEKLKLSSQ